jgi:ABC-2 type transport system permease protein
MSEVRAAGAIYDLGYQRYAGERLGRSYAVRSLLGFSFRTAFGIGRGDRSKVIPVIVAAAVYLPAIFQIFLASAMERPSSVNYAQHLQFTAFLLALFTAAQAPELVVADKQHGVLSLYLSRPLTASDYAFAKLGALFGAMLCLTLGPEFLMFLGRIAMSGTPFATLRDEWTKLLPIVGGTVLTSVFFASIGLLLSSFASRRGYGSAAVIAFFLLVPAAVSMFRSVTSGDIKRYAVLAHPIFLISGFANWLFSIQARQRTTVARADLPGQLYLYVMLGVCVVCTALLVRRYRRAEP